MSRSVNLLPNDEQRQLGEAAQTFLAEQAGPAAWRRTPSSSRARSTAEPSAVNGVTIAV
jgi:hypothetical protein